MNLLLHWPCCLPSAADTRLTRRLTTCPLVYIYGISYNVFILLMCCIGDTEQAGFIWSCIIIPLSIGFVLLMLFFNVEVVFKSSFYYLLHCWWLQCLHRYHGWWSWDKSHHSLFSNVNTHMLTHTLPFFKRTGHINSSSKEVSPSNRGKFKHNSNSAVSITYNTGSVGSSSRFVLLETEFIGLEISDCNGKRKQAYIIFLINHGRWSKQPSSFQVW